MSTIDPPFVTTLADTTGIVGGYRSSGRLCPDDIAGEFLTAGQREWSGPWLACYMIRRFGWPNAGSDDYKQLCEWTLTTPITGFFVSVSPYMGNDNRPVSENLKWRSHHCMHFGIRFTEAAGKVLEQYSPQLLAHWDRDRQLIIDWWATARNQYAFTASDGNDGEELLVKVCEMPDKPGFVWGFYRRADGIELGPTADLPDEILNSFQWYFPKKTRETLGAPDLQARTKEELDAEEIWRAEFLAPYHDAIRATLKDLLRPTNVRDIDFNGMGRCEPEFHGEDGESSNRADYFDGAGYTPEFWYTVMAHEENPEEAAS